jgi:hypothetical protein
VVFLAVLFLGTCHIVTGGGGGPKIVRRNSFGFSEIFIDVGAITGMPWIAAKWRFPIGCEVLEREGIIESDDSRQKRIEQDMDVQEKIKQQMDKLITEEKTKQDTDKPMPKKPTKEDWKAKLRSANRAFALSGQLLGMQNDEFIRLIWQPDHTQTVNGEAVWYYECSDGTIQIVLPAGARLNLVGRVNDY